MKLRAQGQHGAWLQAFQAAKRWTNGPQTQRRMGDQGAAEVQ